MTRTPSGLRLRLLNGKTLAMQNRQGDSARRFSFRDYPKSIGYFVLHRQLDEGDDYLIINARSGKQFALQERPVISPDGLRLVTASPGLSGMSSGNAVQIWRVQPRGVELEFELSPRDWEPSDPKWLDNKTIRLRQQAPLVGESRAFSRSVDLVRLQGKWKLGNAVPGRALMEEVAQAMGGRERILSVRTLILEGIGENYNLGQNTSPEAPLPVYAVTELRRSIDFANRRWRYEQSREPRFPTGNTAAQRTRLGYDSVAFDILPDGTVRRAAGRADSERANELLYHPIGFLQVALAPGTELTEEPSRGELRHVRMNAAGNKFSIFIDRRSSLPVRIEKIEYHPVLGDAAFGTTFSDWRTVDGLLLPMRMVWRIDERWPLGDIRFSKASVNADVGDLAAPTAVRSAQPLAQVVSVTTEEIAPGVWYLAGQTHHSVAIEMRDHLLLVEAPLSDLRTRAVIEKARSLRPGKPVRAVINTHHHFDHSGGIRAAIAEGLTVITHERNKAFFDELARRRHFIVADALASSPRAARIEGVGPRAVLSDGTRSVEIHHIRGNQHGETLLMVYLPAEKLLIEADVYSPPALNATTVPPTPFAANLVENIDRLGLQVDRIVPIHGRVVPMSDLRAAVNSVRLPPPGN